jgi:putative transcriptional regulator
MTLQAFADTYRIPVATLRDWEQGRSRPDGPARALITAIERDPQRLRRLLAGDAT